MNKCSHCGETKKLWKVIVDWENGSHEEFILCDNRFRAKLVELASRRDWRNVTQIYLG